MKTEKAQKELALASILQEKIRSLFPKKKKTESKQMPCAEPSETGSFLFFKRTRTTSFGVT